MAPADAGVTAADHTGFVPAGLTAAQREAVTATDRSLCVLAGAGTGKTRVLTLRVARRIDDGSAEADRVLVCTFSRKAASELRRRLWSLGVGAGVEAGTFHRTALGLLRQHRSDHGRPAPVVVADRRRLLMDHVVAAETGAGTPRPGRGRPLVGAQRVGQLDAEIGWAKARLVPPEAYEAAARRARRKSPGGAARTAELYAAYEQTKRRRGALDLDDLLWECGDLLEDDPTFAAAVRWRFRHLFVDEMQDVNPAQFRFLQALLGGRADLFVVGDPHQSVYGWNGADPGLLERLPSLVPGTRVLRLDENHRCSPQVVAAASAALGLQADRAPASTRADGPLPRVVGHEDDLEEAAWVAHQAWLAHRPGRRWSQLAVLARTNAQLEVLADAFAAARIPVRRAGAEQAPGSDVSVAAPGDVPGVDDGAAGRSDDDRGAQRDDERDAVVLTTFHRAKGLQWPAVFVVGLSDDLVPIASARTPAAVAEERRLLYVALTRAEDELVCTWSRRRSSSAGGRDAQGAAPREPSRWLPAVEAAVAATADEHRAMAPGEVARRLAGLRGTLEAGRVDAAVVTTAGGTRGHRG
ncbi:MAG: ATP-dependent helicase [Acidimicrobiales bacterium]